MDKTKEFFKAHKKLFITLGVIFAVIIILIILMFTLFALRNESIEFHTTTSVYSSEESQQKVLESANFGNECIFFSSKKTYTERIEKNNPYIKVVNIETNFPNSFVVHVCEREEVFALKCGDNFYICDQDLKVLRVTTEFSNDNTNAILVKNSFDLGDAIAGDFLVLNNDINSLLYGLTLSMQINNRTIAQQKGFIKSVEVATRTNVNTAKNEIALVLTDFNDFEITIYNAFDDIDLKAQNLLSAYGNIVSNSPEELLTKQLIVYKNSAGIIQSAKLNK